jgi:oligosaccharide repeat unit polymerase
MYFVISVFLVSISLLFLYRATKNIFSFSFITGVFLTLIFIGCILISSFQFFPLAFYLSLGMISLSLGVIFANKIKRFFPKRELEEFRKLKISSPFKFEIPFSLAFISLIILNILAISYLFLKSGIPLFQESTEAAKIEIAFGSNWILVRSLRIFLPVLLLILYLYMVKTGRFLVKLGFISLVILMGISYLFYGYKGYFFGYLALPLFVLWALVSKIKMKNVLLLGILSLLAASLLTGKMLSTFNPIEISKFILNRFTVIQAEGVDYIVNTLVPKEGFFKGLTFKMDIRELLYKVGILKEEFLNFNAFLVKHKTGSNPQGRIQMASTLFGEFYVNFGLLGGVLATFIAGFLLQLLYITTVRSSKNIFFLPLVIFIQGAISSAIISGHTLITLIDVGVCTLFILFLLLLGYIFFSLPIGQVILLRKKYS